MSKSRFVDSDGDVNIKAVVKTGIIILGIVILTIILWPLKVVGSTERGVIKTFGEVGNEIIQPGLRFKAPFAQTITVYDLSPQTIKIKVPMGEQGAVSKDKQTIGVSGTVIWKFDDNKILNLAREYSNISKLESQVQDTVITSIKNTIGLYDIDQIVQDQKAISDAAHSRMTTIFNSWPVSIDVVNLDNWDWSDDYDAMIKQTVAMRQNAVRAEAELAMIEQQAAQQVKKAEADATAKVAEADGRLRAAQLDAQALEAKAKGVAAAAIEEARGKNEANRLLSQNMAVEVRIRELEIALVEAGKWNGKRVPDYVPLNPTGGLVTLPGR